MTKEELWVIIIRKNPSFASGVVKMAAESLRRLFDLVWDQAVKSQDKGYDFLRDFFGVCK